VDHSLSSPKTVCAWWRATSYERWPCYAEHSGYKGVNLLCILNLLRIIQVLSTNWLTTPWRKKRHILLLYIYIYIYTHTHIYVCVCVCVCVYIYIYIYIYIYKATDKLSPLSLQSVAVHRTCNMSLVTFHVKISYNFRQDSSTYLSSTPVSNSLKTQSAAVCLIHLLFTIL